MIKTKKILTYLFVFLVLITNTGFTFTSEFCSMTKKSTCKCSMNNSNVNVVIKGVVFKSKPCCDEKRKEISNSSVFDSHKKVEINNLSSFISFAEDYSIQTKFSNIPVSTKLVFYNLPRDIPILNSSFQI